MANQPVAVVLITEIILDDGKLPAGVTMADIVKKHDEQVWGTTVPVLGIKATRKRGIPTQIHVHNSTYERACQECVDRKSTRLNSSHT